MSEASESERTRFREARETPLEAGQSPADFADNVVKLISAPDSTQRTRQALRESMAAIPSATYRDALRCFTQPTERFDFACLTMPVLLMTGEHDRLAPPDEIRDVAGRIHAASPLANVRFEVIANAGHVCNLDQPARYTALLSEFLNDIVAVP